jgi:hypothetical protein
VHRLVLETFVGPCPPGLEACHNNGDSLDSRLVNLRWDTRKANAADTTLHGQRVYLRGEKSPGARLTPASVQRARALVAAGQSFRATGRELGVSHRTISDVIRGKRWTHV